MAPIEDEKDKQTFPTVYGRMNFWAALFYILILKLILLFFASNYCKFEKIKKNVAIPKIPFAFVEKMSTFITQTAIIVC